jgi:hypothetical protein
MHHWQATKDTLGDAERYLSRLERIMVANFCHAEPDTDTLLRPETAPARNHSGNIWSLVLVAYLLCHPFPV